MKKHLVETEKYVVYGQLEDMANGNSDPDAFVFRNGEIVSADVAENQGGTVVQTAPEPNYACN